MLEFRQGQLVFRAGVNLRLRAAIGALAMFALIHGPAAWSQATCTWNQNGPGQWDNPGNWNDCSGGNGSTPGTPGSADHAIVGNVAPSADVDLGASPRSVDRLTLSAGRIFGNADLAVTTRLNWTGGSIDGGGSATVLELGSASISDIAGNLHRLARRNLRNLGAITWIGGDIQLEQDCEIDNQGVFTIGTFGQVRAGGEGSPPALRLTSDGSPLARIHNSASVGSRIEKTGLFSVQFMANVRFDNGNTVQVNQGTLQLMGAGTDFGDYQIAAAGRLEFGTQNGVTRELTGSNAISGAGVLHKFGQGQLNISGGYALSGPAALTEVVDGVLSIDVPSAPLLLSNLRVRAPGIFTSPDNVEVGGNFAWDGGEVTGTMAGLSLTLTPTAITTVSLSNSQPSAYLRSRDLINQGSLVIAAAATMPTHFWLDAASIDNQSSFTLSNNSTNNLVLDCTVQDCGSFFNRAAGTLTLTDQSGIPGIGGNLAAFDNAGTVELTQGCAAISAPGTDTGTYRYNSFCSLALFPRPDTERVLQSTVILDQIGNSKLQLGGALRVNGGSRSFGNLILDPAANLFGPAAITFTGITDWRGTIAGAGPTETVTVAPGALLRTSNNPGDTPRLVGRTLHNNGDVNISEVRLQLEGNAEIRNNGLLNLVGTPVAAGAIGCAMPPLCGPITNASAGTIQSTAVIPGPATQLESDITLLNQGSLRVDNGLLILDSSYTAAPGSIIDVGFGAGLRRSVGNLVLAAGFLRGAGVIDASVDADLVAIEPAGAGTGNLAILGSFSATANTAYHMGIAGITPPAVPALGRMASAPAGLPSYDRLTISGNAALNGTLDVIDLGYAASSVDVFDLMQYASYSGAVLAGLNPYAGASLILQTQATRIRLAQAPVAGPCEWNPGAAGANDWTNPAKWINCSGGVGPGPGPAGTPGASDVAVVSGGTVNLDVPVSVGSLQFTNGTIQGPSDLLILNELVWTGGRFQGASGSLVTTTSSTLVSLSGGQHTVDGRTLVLNSSSTWTTGLIELANGGVLDIAPSATLISNPSVAFESVFGSGSGTAEVRNAGLISKQGVNSSGIGQSVQYSGSGNIAVSAGEFIFAASSLTSLNASYGVDPGAGLHFVGGNRSFGVAATLGGPGNLIFGDSSPMAGINTVDGCINSGSTVFIRNAEVVLNCASPSILGSLLILDELAVLEGSSAISVSNAMTWGQGTIRGNGLAQTFEVSPGAIVSFGGTVAPRTLSNRRLRNFGTINWSTPNATQINDGAEFVNESGASIAINAPGLTEFASNQIGSPKLVNSGSINLGQGENGIDVAFDNGGTYTVGANTAVLRRAGNDSGSYSLAAGGSLRLENAAVRTLASSAAISGSGQVQVTGGASLTTAGTFQPHDLRIDSGAFVQIDSASPQLIQTLFLQSGTLTGSAEIRIGAAFDWRNGGVLASVGAAPGPLVIQPAAALDVFSGIYTLSNRVLRIEGLADWRNGSIVVPQGAAGKITVAAGGTLQTRTVKSAAQFRCVAPTCTAEMEITGSLLQIGDGADFALSSPLLINGGSLVVNTASLQAPGVTMTSGAIELITGGTLNASPVTLNGGMLRGIGSVNGAVNNVAGRLRPGASPGQINIVGSYTQGPAGILDIEVAGLAPGVSADRVAATGAGNIDGTVNIIDAGYTPVAPQSIEFLSAGGGLSGTFATRNVPYGGYGISYTPNSAVLSPAAALPLVVTDVGDAGDGVCDSSCTLRDALIGANLAADPDVITFAIPSPQCVGPGGACVIEPSTPLPLISTPVVIDGYTQSGAVANSQAPGLGLGSNAVLKIELSGALAGGGIGLAINAPSSIVAIHGLAMYGWGSAIVTQGPGDASYWIGGNFLGLRADGSTAPSTQLAGVSIQGGSVSIGNGTPAEMNVVSGNQQRGIAITALPALAGVGIAGNLIGTSVDGLSARPNGQQGILLTTSSALASVFIGGSLPDDRNVISGNGQDGIRFDCTAPTGTCFDGTQVHGNFIGPAANGAPLGNAGNGVNLSAMIGGRVDIGGTAPGEGNVIAGNGGNGILATFGGIARGAFQGNVMLGNGLLPIDLGGDGRTANDAGDVDAGPNGRLNFPLISSYVLSPMGDGAAIDVVLSTPDVGGNYPARVEFYKAIEDEPGIYLGATSCSAPPPPPAVAKAVSPLAPCTANLSFPGGVFLAPDDIVLAIVTDAFGKTSEVSVYNTTTTIVADTPDPSTIGTPYTVSVEVASTEPFVPAGAVNVDDGVNSCPIILTSIGPSLAGGSCMLPSVAPAGPITLTASYVSGPNPFFNSSGTDAHTINGAPPPVITLISRSSGPVAGGTPVTLTGSNFVIGATAVSFGATAATGVNCTSTTQCTVTSPAGSGTVSVRATTAAGSSVDTRADDFTYSAPATLCTNVAPASNFAVGTQPRDLAVGDFNGDGKRDLVTVNSAASGEVSVLLGTGTGTFAPAVNYAVGAFPRAVAIGDFNGDGNSDLAVANYGATTVSILLGTGTGSFGAASAVAAGTGPHGVAVGDFNGDGRADLAVVLLDANSVGILLGNGDGTFGSSLSNAGLRSISIAVSDFDRDGRSDFAVGNQTSNAASAVLGLGTGFFGAPSDFPVGSTPWDIVSGDFNGDGISDLAVSNRGSDNVSVLLGNGTGAFSAATNFATALQPSGLDVGDFNGDGNIDLVVGNSGSANVSLLLGNGTGGFGPALNFAAGNGPSSTVFGDFNGDNRPDIAVANEFANNVSILGNLGCPPAVTMISPSSGPIAGGTVVTLTGTDFVVGATSVTFGASAATGVSCSSTSQCTATSPAGSGTVSVRATTAAGTSADTAADDFTYVASPLATVTAISGIAPQPSVVGQPYTVSVTVTESGSAVTVGSVEVRQLSDGASCLIDLSIASSCPLIGNSALTTAVRARYLGNGLLQPSSSSAQSHVVDRADTAVLIVSDTPDPSQVLEPVLVTADVSALAPGAGTPGGEILITDGTASCSIVLPGRSCSLIPKALGQATLEARYLGDANFNASVDTEAHTIVVDGADLSIVKRNGLRLIPGGQPSTYILLVSNAGPQAVVNARVTDILPLQFSDASWTCSGSGGASCPASGGGSVDALVSLPAGSSLSFALTATAQAAPEQVVSNRATVTPPLNAPDPLMGNNESVDTDPIGVFGEGFETENE